MLTAGPFSLLLIPHCESQSRDGWDGDHDERPLSAAGREQAQALALAISADAVYTSPTLRCRQTVEPLAERLGLPVLVLPELYEAAGFHEPAEWVDGVYAPMGQAIAGAWVAGRALGGLVRLSGAHPGGRVVACSHGDVIPVLLSLLAGAYSVPLPPLVERGGWYTLLFTADRLSVTTGIDLL